MKPSFAMNLNTPKTLLAFLTSLLLSTAGWAGITVERLSIEKEAARGESYSASIAVANEDSVTRHVILYQRDYSFSCDGSNHFDDPGQLKRSNAAWISLNPTRLEIPPGQTSYAYCSIQVPDDSTLTGTYWSIIMVEESPDPEGYKPIQLERNQTGIVQSIRYGVQCVTHIGSTGTNHLSILGSRIIADDSSGEELQVDVENTGDRWARPIAWAELYNETGRRIGRFETESRRIFPGTSVRFRIPLGSTTAGKYKAFVVLDNGDQDVIGAKYDLEF